MNFLEHWKERRARRKAGYFVPHFNVCTCFLPENTERHMQRLYEMIEILDWEEAEKERRKAEQEGKAKRKMVKRERKKMKAHRE